MGRKADFTEASILEAGERLRADGLAVTAWGLRTQLGGGKPQRLISVWRAATGEAEVEDGPMSTRSLGTALEALRSGIDGLAGDTIERLRTGAAEAVAAALADKDRAVEEATRDAQGAVTALELELGRAAERAEALAGKLALVGEAAARTHKAEAEVADLREQLSVTSRTLVLSAEKTVTAELRAREAEERERAALGRAAVAEGRMGDLELRERAALERAASAEARLVEAARREQAAVQRAEAAEARPTVHVGRRRGAPEPVPATKAALAQDGTGDSS